MIPANQNLIRTGDLARELDVDDDTICIWARKDAAFRSAKFRRGWFKVQVLRDAGILSKPFASTP